MSIPVGPISGKITAATTNRTAQPEIHAHELAEERDAEALGSALLRFSRSPQLCDEFGYRANFSVRENFEQAVQTDQLEAHYDEAIELAAGRVEAISSGVRSLSPRFAEELSVD